MAITKYGDIGMRSGIHVQATMLKHAMSVEILAKFGARPQPIPANSGLKSKFRRLIPFTAVTTPLIEGVTPPSTPFGHEFVEVDLKQYGDWSETTDVVIDTHEDPIMQDLAQLHGENAGRTQEATLWATLRGGTSVFYGGDATSRATVVEPITRAKQRKVTRFLKAQKAQKVRQMLSGSPNTSTSPIEAAYIAVAHTDLESDIRNMEGFIPTAKYGTRDVLCAEEIGAVEDVRYVLSPDLDNYINAGGIPTSGSVSTVSTGGAASDVYPILYFGQDAYGTVPLRGKGAIKPMVRNPTPTDTDPLAQRGSVAWKGYWANLILNDLWMARVEVAASNL